MRPSNTHTRQLELEIDPDHMLAAVVNLESTYDRYFTAANQIILELLNTSSNIATTISAKIATLLEEMAVSKELKVAQSSQREQAFITEMSEKIAGHEWLKDCSIKASFIEEAFRATAATYSVTLR